jgi:hypothetical protein
MGQSNGNMLKHIGNNRIQQNPTLAITPKKKNQAPWVHAGSRQWLQSLSLPTLVLYQF